MNVVDIHDLRKDFGNRLALDVPSLQVDRKSTTAIIGPNGAGKSTLLRILTGLWRPSSVSSLTVMGHNLLTKQGRQVAARSIGLVGEPTQLFGTLTVRENIDYCARLWKIPRRLRDSRISSALHACGLEDRQHDVVWKLSTGLKQRANIATSLVTQPTLLFLDEPTSGLDPAAVQQVYNVVHALRREGTSIVMCTHIMTEVSDLCDRVLFLKDGRIVADDTPASLQQHVGKAAVTLEVLDEQQDATLAHLADAGITRTTTRRDNGRVLLTFFECVDTSFLESLDVPYSRRPASLADAFMSLAGAE